MNANKLKIASLSTLAILGACNSSSDKGKPDSRDDAQQSQQPYNIIFIMTDDHTQQAISAYGSTLTQTPNIDRLAEEGMLFRDAYVTNSISSPSRAVLLTGKYSHINGVYNNKIPFNGDQETFPKLLQQAGYQTAIFGKWHLKSAPQGFDYWKILPGQGNYYNPWFVTNGDTAQANGYVTDLTTDYALDWLKSKRDTAKPFVMLCHHKAPHRGWYPALRHLKAYTQKTYPIPESYWDDYQNRGTAAKDAEMRIAEDMYLAWDLKVKPEDPLTIKEGAGAENNYRWTYKMMSPEQRQQWDAVYDSITDDYNNTPRGDKEKAEWRYQRYMQDYMACVAAVDENIGRLLDYLDESGLAENTIVVYTSDQGFYLGEHGWFDKRFMYEESFHTPLLIRGPVVAKPGSENTDFVMNLDFAETFLDIAGVEIPKKMQGRSILPILKGQTPEDWRTAMYYHYYEYPGAHSVKRHYGIKTRDYKLIHFYYDVDEWELYDLKKDPTEMTNCYDDPAYADIITDLKQQLDELQEQYGDSDELRQQILEETLHSKTDRH